MLGCIQSYDGLIVCSRDNVKILPPNLIETQTKAANPQIVSASAVAVHQDEAEECVPSKPKLDKGKGRAKEAPATQPLRTKTNAAKVTSSKPIQLIAELVIRILLLLVQQQRVPLQ